MKNILNYIRIAGIAVVAVLLLTHTANANIIDDLKNKISERADRIEDLEAEIRDTTKKITEVQAESQTLSSSIRTLDLSRQKLLQDIEVTRNEIDATQYTIEKIQYEILEAEQDIYIDNAQIIHLLQSINEVEAQSLLEILLSNDELIDFWNDVESMQRIRGVVRENLSELELLKVSLEEKEHEARKEKADLEQLDTRYTDQKSIVESNKRAKSQLLAETKNKEETYREVLLDKIAAKEAFEREILEYEAQLKIIIDASKLPTVGTNVLLTPLPDVSLAACSSDEADGENCITQYFGDTPFAKSGAYNGSGHNGMDFRAAVGTPVYASYSGTIAGVGNTDAYPGCYSYGKWVLATHDNGLSTLYAHLSLIKVSDGQYVRAGDLIGYSGNTGYSTGPHLHYAVYATEGVSIVRLGDIKKITNCGQAYIPVASYNAYLNPLDYLFVP